MSFQGTKTRSSTDGTSLGIQPVLFHYWTSVVDAGPVVKQHCLNARVSWDNSFLVGVNMTFRENTADRNIDQLPFFYAAYLGDFFIH